MIKLRVKGKAVNINTPIVGKVTRKSSDTYEKNSFFLLEGEKTQIPNFPFLGILSTHDNFTSSLPTVNRLKSLSHLEEGDIVAITEKGNVNTLYRVNSFHNSLLTTERCNSNCLMCSQPPKDRNDIPFLYKIHKQLIPMIPKDCPELVISGGEPTLMGELFFDLLNQIREELPNTEVHVLTNGRTFAWYEFTEKLARLNNDKVMFGIPVYSDFYQSHDYIVQSNNAFYQTILGIHNLARFNLRVEIRVVLHMQSIPRLVKLAKYIYKNLPFVEHITFMGLEHIGYTPFNMNRLWIDPFDYQNELEEAVEYLSTKGLRVSIYNIPLCVLPQTVWKNARKSISDWKNDYLPECKECSKRDECGGFFTWNLNHVSSHIKPFV